MRVLVVEDDRQTVLYIRDGLAYAGWQVDVAEDGETGLQLASDPTPFDVLVIDRLLPKLDGLGMLTTLRARDVRTPALFLTALSAIADRVEGLEAGADDYLVKPFSIAELAARVGALARRPAMRDGATLQVGALSLDRLQRVAMRGERRIDLLPLQFKLLEVLMLNGGRPVTRTMLLERVWGLKFDPRTNIVETHISHLRAKIDMSGEPSAIVTLRGAGYAIRAP